MPLTIRLLSRPGLCACLRRTLAGLLLVAAASASCASPGSGLNHADMSGIREGTLGRQMIVLCVERDGRRAYYRAADAIEHVMIAEGHDRVERVDGRPTHRWIGDARPLGFHRTLPPHADRLRPPVRVSPRGSAKTRCQLKL